MQKSVFVFIIILSFNMYIILVEDKELLVFQLGIENGRDFGKRALQRIKNCEKGQYSYPEFWGEIFTLSGVFFTMT